jgi:hypothetical protein
MPRLRSKALDTDMDDTATICDNWFFKLAQMLSYPSDILDCSQSIISTATICYNSLICIPAFFGSPGAVLALFQVGKTPNCRCSDNNGGILRCHQPGTRSGGDDSVGITRHCEAASPKQSPAHHRPGQNQEIASLCSQ